MVCLQEHLWLSAGVVWSLPLYRLAGLYAPANGEMSTASFAWPAGGVTVNAALKWRGRTVTGGCDEGCAGYLFFELLDHVRPAPRSLCCFCLGPAISLSECVPEDSTNADRELHSFDVLTPCRTFRRRRSRWRGTGAATPRCSRTQTTSRCPWSGAGSSQRRRWRLGDASCSGCSFAMRRCIPSTRSLGSDALKSTRRPRAFKWTRPCSHCCSLAAP